MDQEAETEVLGHQAALEVPISRFAIEAGATLHQARAQASPHRTAAQTEADIVHLLHVLEGTVDEGPRGQKIGNEENADYGPRTRCLSSRYV